jgi:hypothetical protein
MLKKKLAFQAATRIHVSICQYYATASYLQIIAAIRYFLLKYDTCKFCRLISKKQNQLIEDLEEATLAVGKERVIESGKGKEQGGEFLELGSTTSTK